MLRLSINFLLLDFLYGQSTIDCVAQNGELVFDKISSIKEDTEVIEEGRNLCNTILERIVEDGGRVSIGAGLWFRKLPLAGKAFLPDGPHEWKPNIGAAADIVVHSWVNDEKSPKCFLKTLPGKDIEYDRTIPYRGSEFCCIASRLQGNKYRLGVEKWDKLKEQAVKGTLPDGGGKDWRRIPYTHSHGQKSKSDLEYKNRVRVAESLWSEEPSEGIRKNTTESVIYGRKLSKGKSPLDHSIVEVPNGAFDDHSADGQKVVRSWHVRVSRYFVLLDFCRDERMFERKMATVPPLTFRTANTVIKVARMFGEILDPVKDDLGNISVVRGMEPKGFANDGRTQCHRWIPGDGNTHSVEFVTPENPKLKYRDLRKGLEEDDRVVDCNRADGPDLGGDRVRLTIRDFNPSHHFTSADGDEFPWTEMPDAGIRPCGTVRE